MNIQSSMILVTEKWYPDLKLSNHWEQKQLRSRGSRKFANSFTIWFILKVYYVCMMYKRSERQYIQDLCNNQPFPSLKEKNQEISIQLRKQKYFINFFHEFYKSRKLKTFNLRHGSKYGALKMDTDTSLCEKIIESSVILEYICIIYHQKGN